MQGKEKPETLATVYALATVVDARGYLLAAEALYRRALAGTEHALPPEDPQRLSLDDSYASLLRKEGRPNFARHAVEGARKSLKENDPDRARYEQHLAALQTGAASGHGTAAR